MSNPTNATAKTEFIPLLIIIATITAAVFFYFNLPDRIVVHWNFAGEPDGYGSGKIQAIVLPLVILVMYLLFLFLPYLDPKQERYKQFAKVYHIFKAMVMALMFAVFMIVGLNGLGYNLPVGVITPVMIGLLFIVLGNYFGKIKMNWFFGIKTPWTLSSEEVWNKTHRFGGKMFILAGLIMMAETIVPVSWRLPLFIVMLVILLVGTIGYSYFVYLKEKGK